jgi:hypothetical protein
MLDKQMTLTNEQVKLLAKFFLEELGSDPVFVGEWLESRLGEHGADSFVEVVAAYVNE